MISVVVVSWNGRELTEACLDSLAKQDLEEAELEVLVVDNGSTDGSAETLAARVGVRLIANPDNRGFGRAANQGIRASQGELVLLLNNDTELPDPSAVREAAAFMDAHPDAGALGVRLENADGSLQISCARFRSLAAEVRNSIPVRLLLGPRPEALWYTEADHQRTGPVDWVMGAFLLLRRSALEQVGLLHEGEHLYGEDHDLCYRLAGRGWRTYFLSTVRAVHVGNASAAAVYSPMQREVRVLEAERRMLARHRGGAFSWAYAILVALDRTTKLLAARLLGRRTEAGRLGDEVRARWRALRP
ncbi:MAG: glycosyltransferase family 2 protein [Actinobacteria bacterium]|nr:glycosyltransferase family 2 protein [Actinomycetota bacterium]